MVSGGRRPVGTNGAEQKVAVGRMRVMQATNHTLCSGGAVGSVKGRVHHSHWKALLSEVLALCGTTVQT